MEVCMNVNKKSFERLCPICNKKLIHSYSYESQKNQIIKDNRCCRSCSSKEKQVKYKEKYTSALKKLNESQKGENNPFYGKHHSNEFKNKLKKDREGKQLHTTQSKNLLSQASKGSNNPMHGRKVFDIWVEKYGHDIALQKEKEWKEKLSKRNSGENNPMYGKPTPHSAGKGTSGYYKGFHFRSLHELHYILTVLEPNNIPLVSAGKSIYKIPYIDFNGHNRTYVADFIVNNSLIEIKPNKLINSKFVQLKATYAKTFCESKNMTYQLIGMDAKDINYILIKEKYKEGLVVFNKIPKQFL
jgi:hypothetical protein